MEPTNSFAEFLRALDESANAAAEQVVKRFATDLVMLAARRMSARLQARVGPEDVVQSVLLAFFCDSAFGHVEFRDWNSLWGLLATVTVRRIYRHAKRNAAARRAQDNERPFDSAVIVFARPATDTDADHAEHLLAQLLERVRAARPGARGELHARAVERMCAGAKHADIADELKLSISTIERVHRRARELLEQLRAEADAE